MSFHWLFFLGDFCFRNTGGSNKAEDYLNRLNGKFVFIRGNHDNNNSLKTKLHSCVVNMGNMNIFLVHDPINFKPEYHLIFHLVFHGHVHNNWKFRKVDDNYLINVGVDVWDFMPVKFNEIMKQFNRWKNDINRNSKIAKKKNT